jgi:hypothetical protein
LKISVSETIAEAWLKTVAPRVAEAGFKSKEMYPSIQMSYE